MRYRNFRPGDQKAHWTRVAGMRLLVEQGVFDPGLHFTSGFFASYLLHSRAVRPGSHVLEVGTGTGLLAMAAGQAGAGRVVAIDINPVAVPCATGNVRRYGLDRVVTVIQGDMFEPFAGARFDLILCNPPYFRGDPTSDPERAYFGGSDLEWIDRFASEAAGFLTAGGSCLIVLGDAAEMRTILVRFTRRDWHLTVAARKEMLVETLYILRLRPSSAWQANADGPPVIHPR